MLEHPNEALKVLACQAEVAPFDFTDLERAAKLRRMRKSGLVALLALGLTGSAALVVAARLDDQSVLRQAQIDQAMSKEYYLRVLTPQSFEQEAGSSAGLPEGARSCLPDSAEQAAAVPYGNLYKMAGSLGQRDRTIACLEAHEGVRVFVQTTEQHRAVYGPRDGANVMTDEQMRRAGVDATEECTLPGVRQSAPPFESEPPLATAELIAAYLTDGYGYEDWDYEFNASLSSASLVPGDRLIRLCWFRGDGDYQLVVSAVGGDALPNANARGPQPIPVLAPPPPRAMTADEVRSRMRTFEQPGSG